MSIEIKRVYHLLLPSVSVYNNKQPAGLWEFQKEFLL